MTDVVAGRLRVAAVEEAEQRGGVVGLQVDLALLDRRHHDGAGAEGGLDRHLVAGLLQDVGPDVRDDGLLLEVGRADDDRGLARGPGRGSGERAGRASVAPRAARTPAARKRVRRMEGTFFIVGVPPDFRGETVTSPSAIRNADLFHRE